MLGMVTTGSMSDMFSSMIESWEINQSGPRMSVPVYTGGDAALVVSVKAVFGFLIFWLAFGIIHFMGWEFVGALVVAWCLTDSLRLKLRHPKEPTHSA